MSCSKLKDKIFKDQQDGKIAKILDPGQSRQQLMTQPISLNINDLKKLGQVEVPFDIDRSSAKNTFAPTFGLTMFANSRGGKSYQIVDILTNPKYDLVPRFFRPENIYICSPKAKNDKTYKKFWDFMSQFENFRQEKQLVQEPSKVEQFVQGKIKENDYLVDQGIIRYLLFIFDDLFSRKDFSMGNDSCIAELSTTGRHSNISFIATTNSYKEVGNAIRRNSTMLILYEFSNAKEIEDAVSEVRGFMTADEFKKMFIMAIRSERNGFIFYNRLMPHKLKYNRCLQEIIEIDD